MCKKRTVWFYWLVLGASDEPCHFWLLQTPIGFGCPVTAAVTLSLSCLFSLENWCHQTTGNVSLTNQPGPKLKCQSWFHCQRLNIGSLSSSSASQNVRTGWFMAENYLISYMSMLAAGLSLMTFIWLTHLSKRYPTSIWWLRRQENPSLLPMKVQWSLCLLWMMKSLSRGQAQQAEGWREADVKSFVPAGRCSTSSGQSQSFFYFPHTTCDYFWFLFFFL